MRLILLPVTTILEHPHVLLKYDFISKVKDNVAKEFGMTAFYENMLPGGSVVTVCEMIKKYSILKKLLSLKDDVDYEKLDNHIDFKHRLRFFSLGENSDVCICALAVYLQLSAVLNGNEETSMVNGLCKSPSAKKRDHYHFWIRIRDIKDKLIAVDRMLKQTGIAYVLTMIDQWAVHGKHSYLDIPISDKSLMKNKFRFMIWDLMEQKQEILFPHPCHGKIPNFRGRETAAENLTALEIFKKSRVIKINPSLAQEHLRFLTMTNCKVLLTPSPALESALLYKIDPQFLSRKQIQRASTRNGAASLGSVLSLSALGNLHADLVVVGSVVVNPITGARLGKGHGYGDLEYAVMRQLGAVDDRTVVATVVHESQLVNDLPNSVMEPHDLPVNIVATPKRVIFTKCSFERPHHVNWSNITVEMLQNIPVLRELQHLEHVHDQSIGRNLNNGIQAFTC